MCPQKSPSPDNVPVFIRLGHKWANPGVQQECQDHSVQFGLRGRAGKGVVYPHPGSIPAFLQTQDSNEMLSDFPAVL